MKLNLPRALGACAVLAAAAFAGAAQAHTAWSVGVNLAPGVVVGASNYYARPVVVAPAPVYVAPAPVYVAPAPVYAAPAPVYAPAYAPVVAPVYVAPRRVVVRPVMYPAYRPVYRPAGVSIRVGL